MIPQGKVGVVTAADGEPLDPGRLLGKAIDGHRNFQDAEQFIASGGQKGPQVEILTPGIYRILTSHSISMEDNSIKPGLFTVQLFDATVINENQIGLVEASGRRAAKSARLRSGVGAGARQFSGRR